jgi:hypothetical protein
MTEPNASTRAVPHRRSRIADSNSWRTDLPRKWQDAVIVPLALEIHRDYEMAAERIVGRDEDDAACYCASRFIVTETRSDDDEEFYQIAAYAESLSAWRMRDGRWLIHRIITCEGERGSGVYSFGDRMPR